VVTSSKNFGAWEPVDTRAKKHLLANFAPYGVKFSHNTKVFFQKFFLPDTKFAQKL